MNSDFDTRRFGEVIARLGSSRPAVDRHRLLAWYAAAVVSADDTLMGQTVRVAREAGVSREALYEIALQSYLFVGFPRMLVAGDHLATAWPHPQTALPHEYDPHDTLAERRRRGEQLCARIYNNSYHPLKARVQTFAPEIWQWMIEEGYGKVLSRPGLEPIDRELCTVASLMVDLMPRQLHSHMRGALNVGATEENLRQVVDDIGSATAAGHRAALDILAQIGRR